MADAITSFGAWLRRRRKALDLTQDALALRVGCSKDLIVKIEGDTRRPSRQVAGLLATHLCLRSEEHDDFIRCARAELAADRLPPPTDSVPRPTLVRAIIADTTRRNLPVHLSSFLGREREISELTDLLKQINVRLLTLTGPGGTGKTRLALQVAAASLSEYPDGVWFVDLSPISDPQQVAATIVQTLGLSDRSDQTPQECLVGWLRSKQVLLLLDNFEQTVEAGILVAVLLQAAPQLSVLVTSRVPLRIQGEQEYLVAPLALPLRESSTRHRESELATGDAALDSRFAVLASVKDITQYASVRLFIERAQAIKPDFHVTPTNAPAVAEICTRLDGLPLAIELAAARIRMFAPDQLLLRLISARMQTLTGGARDLPTRQQTMRATIDWSYRLLTPAHQRLFMRLGVFVGGWTLAAAEVVCAEDGLDVSEGLQALVEHSLVRMVDSTAEMRTIMLETIREYALEQLRSLDSAATIYDRHAGYCAALAAQLEPKLWTDQQHWALDHLYQDVDNLRAALSYTTRVASSDDHARIALSLATSLQLFWCERTTLAEGLHWIKDALSAARERLPALRARALYVYGEMAGWSGLTDEAERTLQTGRVVSIHANAPETTARILHALSELCYYRGNVHQGLPYAIEGFSVAEQIGDNDACGWTMLDCARMRYFYGDLQQVRSNVQSAIRFFEQANDAHGTYYSRVLMAEILLDCGETLLIDDVFRAMRDVEHAEVALVEAIGWRIAGDFEQARRYFEQKLTNISAADDPLGHAMVSYELGAALLLQGNLSRARTILYQALPSVGRIANRWIAAMVYHAAGVVDISCGYITEAQAYLTTSLQIYRAMSQGTRAVDLGLAATLDGLAAVAAAETLQHEIIVSRATQAVRWWGLAAQVRAGYQPGFFPSPCVAPLPINLEIIEHNKALVRAALGDEAFVAAWATGQTLTLDNVIAEALAFTIFPAATL